MNRPEDIERRIVNIRQIESIIGTLRALASAHLIEARGHLDAIRAHEAVIGGALSVALPGRERAEQDRKDAGTGQGLTILVGATQGFCGAYADRLVAAGRDAAGQGRLMVVGARSLAGLEGLGTALKWSADMAPHAADIPALANRLADALFAELADRPDCTVQILYADPADPERAVQRRRLWPFDFDRFPASAGARPITTLAAAPLTGTLVQEYVFAELCEALMLGFAAENAARAEAMARAQSNVKRIAADLKGEFQRARQEQMTTEIIELSAGQGASR